MVDKWSSERQVDVSKKCYNKLMSLKMIASNIYSQTYKCYPEQPMAVIFIKKHIIFIFFKQFLVLTNFGKDSPPPKKKKIRTT